MQFRKLKQLYYRLRYGFVFNDPLPKDGDPPTIRNRNTLLPDLGKTNHYEVVRKGNYIEIIQLDGHGRLMSKDNRIRMIPIKGNHGFHVECRTNGALQARRGMGFDNLIEFVLNGAEKEE